MRKLTLLFLISFAFSQVAYVPIMTPREKTVVMCLGDSRTAEGNVYTNNPTPGTYPAELQKLLGSNYIVKQYGIGGTAVSKNHPRSVWKHNNGHLATMVQRARNDQTWGDLADKNTIVIFHYGTVDANKMYWNLVKGDFVNNYKSFINMFKGSKFVCISPGVVEAMTNYTTNHYLGQLNDLQDKISDYIEIEKNRSPLSNDLREYYRRDSF